MAPRRVVIKRDVIDGLLSYCHDFHPREGILLLRGKTKKDEIEVNALMIPPLPVHSETYSSFPAHMLPLDTSILGIAHSHPNGVLRPSLEDLNNYFGRLMIIVGPPYESEANVALFDREGNRAVYYVV
ncbi:MAG: Mov34/MPN/PAD-1 family protein [Thaumarchaeota archaeon]|nr:Mov34/MPN/PAD-1 family protein [Nitrososphaerota archaeon]